MSRAQIMTAANLCREAVLPPAVTWHNLDTKTLFLHVLSVVSWIFIKI